MSSLGRLGGENPRKRGPKTLNFTLSQPFTEGSIASTISPGGFTQFADEPKWLPSSFIARPSRHPYSPVTPAKAGVQSACGPQYRRYASSPQRRSRASYLQHTPQAPVRLGRFGPTNEERARPRLSQALWIPAYAGMTVGSAPLPSRTGPPSSMQKQKKEVRGVPTYPQLARSAIARSARRGCGYAGVGTAATHLPTPLG
jgi:hypothetical protein